MRIPAYCILFLLLISITACDYGTNTTILENGSYFNGHSFIPFAELIIKGDKIKAIYTQHTNAKGRRIDLAGKYLIPGLIDAHVHLGSSPLGELAPSTAEWNANSSLNCGVTTVIDLFYQESKYKELRTVLKNAPAYYATPLFAGPILTAPGGHGTEYGISTRTITNVYEAESVTNDVIDNGVDVIKLVYNRYKDPQHCLSFEMLKKIAETAHKRNKKVFAHIDLSAEAVDCAKAGVDVLAHIPSDSLSNEQLNEIKRSGIVLIPTFTIMQVIKEGFDATYLSDPLLHRTGNPSYLSKFGNIALLALYPNVEYKSRANLAHCIQNAIPIMAGTDAGNPYTFYGYSLHNELQQYVKEGMSNADALNTATENIHLIFPHMKIGKIDVGYDADMVMLSKNPLDDIANTKTIQMIFHKGQLAKRLQ